MILYDLLLLLIALLAFPRLLYLWAFHRKYRGSLKQRFGIGFPNIIKGKSKLVWIHAVSMGETRAVATLVKKIKQEEPETIILLSCITETGFTEGKRTVKNADYHVFLPLDFGWIIRPIVRRVSPDLVLLCETDFWYNFLSEAKKNGASIAVVNGKLSERSAERYALFPSFARRLFGLVDLFCLQSSHYKARFKKLGISDNKLPITGNLKLESQPQRITPEKIREKKVAWGLPPDNLILVVGSTHFPEEDLLLDALEKIWPLVPNVTTILVPRHPERFDEVARILRKREIPYRRYSDGIGSTMKEKILLLDAMGLLNESYQMADLALVGGSFTPKVGGHNIIEPAWFGVPVLFGPYMHTQPAMVEWVMEYQAGRQVSAEALSEALLELLTNPSARQALGQGGRKMTHNFAGATNRTYEAIKNL